MKMEGPTIMRMRWCLPVRFSVSTTVIQTLGGKLQGIPAPRPIEKMFPWSKKQQLITCPMNINRWTQRERNSTDVHLKNGHPPTFPWTWNLTKVRVKKEQQVFTGKNKHPPYPRGGWTSMDVRKKETTSTQRCMQSDHKKRSPEDGPQRVSTKEWKNIQQPITLRKKPRTNVSPRNEHPWKNQLKK